MMISFLKLAIVFLLFGTIYDYNYTTEVPFQHLEEMIDEELVTRIELDVLRSTAYYRVNHKKYATVVIGERNKQLISNLSTHHSTNYVLVIIYFVLILLAFRYIINIVVELI